MTIDNIKKLYFERGLSSHEIAKKIGKTTWQVISLMKKHNLNLRTSAETQKLQFMKKPTSFHEITNLSPKEILLHQAGLMIYWAEGAKTYSSTVDFANSDERMILIFIRMLRTIYRVDEKRLRVLVYCYANQNSLELIKYWSKKLIIPVSQFIKPYVRQDFNPNKTYKMPHGLVHVRYNDKKLFMKIWEEIDTIAASLSC